MKQDVINNIEQWLARYASQRPAAEQNQLRRAAQLLRGPDIFSPQNPAMGRAGTVADLHLDVQCIITAMLCDAVSKGSISEQLLSQDFGKEITKLIAQTNTALSTIHLSLKELPEEEKTQQIEQLRRMLLASVDDVRVILISLADRLQILRQAASIEEEPRRKLAEEAMQVYVPLANRLGVGQLKWEMEDWCFRYLDPEQYRRIAKMLDERRADRERYIADLVATLKNRLSEYGIQAEVYGRAKHIYSIWKKMQKKGQNFHELFDIRAVRVLVDTEVQCYTVLGITHTQWQAIPGEFDDYIAVPKKNQYQSLHTAVIGPENKTVEVQIRTHAMHEHAEFGVAAHWAYKEGGGKKTGDRRLVWLRGLIESMANAPEGSVSTEELRDQLAEDRIFVFTPKGKILDFPPGATPVDFAYSIHTEVGHACRGAKINGRMVPLNTVLHNGDRVEILTAKQGGPSRDWLNPVLGYAHTGKARNKIKEWFNKQDYTDNVQAGRMALERELKRLNNHDVSLEQLAAQLRMPAEEMFAKIGRGDLGVNQVAGLLQRKAETVKPPRARKSETSGSVQILGVGNLLIHLAPCCKPVAHDPIVGFITHRRGVMVHRADCSNILQLQDQSRDRIVAVEWADTSHPQYAVDVQIRAYQRHGLVKDITTLLSTERIPIISIQMESEKNDNTASIDLAIEITSLEQLGRILARLTQIPNVFQAQRR